MTSSRIVRAAAISGILLGLLASGTTWALTDEEVFRQFRFNFLNPGARSLGLGGAFIAEANDATAAEANPAALHYVSQYEVFAEYRIIQTETQVFTSGEPVDKTDIPVDLPFVDLSTATVQDDVGIPSFFSFVVPFKGGRTTLAFSRQVVLDVTSSLDQDRTSLDFAFEGYPLWVNPDVPQVEQYSIENSSLGRLNSELLHYNLALSVDIIRDFSLGLTATYATLDMDSLVQNQTSDPRGILETINPRTDDNLDGLFEDLVTTSVIDGQTDSDVTYSFGLHYHPDSMFKRGISPVKFGLVYHKGAELTVQQSVWEEQTLVKTFDNTLKVPDRFGLGVSGELGAKRHWVISMDLEHIKYSDLLEGYESGVNFFTSGLIDPDAVMQDPNAEIEFTVDDAIVVHGGIEYTFVTRSRWAFGFRAGFYNSPDNRIRMVQFNSTDQTVNERYLDAFRGGEDENHVTAGFSFETPVGLQVQLAGDFADSQTQLLTSLIYRFGRTRR